jgi:integrase
MNGSGTIYQRGNIWWVQVYVDGKPVIQCKSRQKKDAINLRNRLLAKKARGEIAGGAPERVLIGELLDDLLKSGKHKPDTLYIWEKVIQKSVKPYFGKIKAARLTTDLMEQYRKQRKVAGVSDTTVNRELALVRMAFNLGRKRTPPKVHIMPYFPMVTETNVRKGFLTDEQYADLRDALPDELKPIFVTGYVTGIRKSELLAIQWCHVDFEGNTITLQRGETKNKEARTVPIVEGDMLTFLKKAKDECPGSPWVFHRNGAPIKDFRKTWENVCKRVGVPDLQFHDLRRTAVRNMRRSGVPQVIRMKISGHKTDSMERRYNIVDAEDLNMARELMAKRMAVAESVVVPRKPAILGDTPKPEEPTT